MATNKPQVERMEANLRMQELSREITRVNPVYRELPKRETHLDVLEQFKANVSQIEDLFGRLRFALSEVRSAIKK